MQQNQPRTPPRLAIVVSHPIQHFAPWFRETAARDDIELKVFYCCDHGATHYMDRDFGRTLQWDVPLLDGYPYEMLPIATRPESMGFLSVDNPAVGARLSSFAPDVVMVFGYAYRTNWRVARWARHRDVPLMIYSDTNAAQARPFWRRIVREPIVRAFYRHVDAALCVGDNNRAAHASYGIPEQRLLRGMLPIDRERLVSSVPDRTASRHSVRLEHGIPDDAFVVAWCGKFIPRKRPQDLVAAVRRARAAGVPAWALLIGEGPERASLEAMVGREGLDAVTLTGFVNQERIPHYFAASDAIAVTSSRDPHPLVVTEASAFGLPVIASDALGCVGPTDTARPGHNALVYPCADDAALFDAIAKLHSDPDLYQKMSMAGEEIARSQDAAAAAAALSDGTAALVQLGRR